ncbi:T9SS type A sorting domain-containing protein [candidate division KSB1 bacterium]|nr:T9SS type A sorting domain-containing protein [candidate division KSB1 bacterium]
METHFFHSANKYHFLISFLTKLWRCTMSRIICTMSILLLIILSVEAKIIKIPADYVKIQAGIDAAAKGDTVLVADNTYYENINFKGKAITVASFYWMDGDTTHINKTIIDGNKPSHADSGSVVFFVSGEDTTSVLCGFTITKGSGTETSYWDSGTQYFCRAGGGIFCYNSGARITNNKILYNAVASSDKRVMGGGIAALPLESMAYVILGENQIMHNTITANTDFALGGGVELFCNGILANNLISYNSVVHNATTTQASGGGLACRSLSSDRRTVIMDFNKITHNSVVSYSNNVPAALGGGVTISRSQGRFTKNQVSHNEIWVQADQYGCGAGMEILGVPDSFIIEGNIIRGNAVKRGNGYGGGINIAEQASPTFINNIIEGNSATNGGGFIITGNSVVKLINNTIVNNLATSGGGICTGSSNSTNYLINTIIWGNQASTDAGIHINTGTITAAYSDIQGGWSGTGNIDTNPLFAFLNYQLSNSSPCIGAGIGSMQIGGTMYNCPNSDIEGNPRPNPAGSKPDIGAYEHPLGTLSGLILVPEQYANIQAGINAAKDGDLVLVRDNTYYENINFKGKAITVASYYWMDGDTTHINNTVIDGSKPVHADSGSVVFFVSREDTTSVICGFTITGGTGTAATPPGGSIRAGGGIFCYNSGARIINNKIIENTVHSPDKNVYGGGLAALPISSTAYVILQDNQISHNTLTADSKEVGGGGVELMGNGILVNNLISYNAIVHNATNYQAFSGGVDCWSKSADRRKAIVESNKIIHNSVVSKSNGPGTTAIGGGISFVGSFGRCTKNEVSDNEVWANSNKEAGGAGIFINQALSLIIEGNIIHNNAVKRGYGYGGGVLIGEYSYPKVINNIIEGNSASVGGGLIIAKSTADLINNTVINNQATNGGGINVRMSSKVYLMNTIVWGNQASTYAGIQLESGNTAQAACCDIQGGWTGTGNINLDPKLVVDSLLSDSPCIDAGIESHDFGNSVVCICPPIDINGRPRLLGAHPDIGAWESLPPDAVEEKLDHFSNDFALQQNYPNPFNPNTIIQYALPNPGHVQLLIYDTLGRNIKTLTDAQQPAGQFQEIWDGTNEQNQSVAAGVYFCHLKVSAPSKSSGGGVEQDFVKVIKLVLVK